MFLSGSGWSQCHAFAKQPFIDPSLSALRIVPEGAFYGGILAVVLVGIVNRRLGW